MGTDFEGVLDYVEHSTKTRITGFGTGHPAAVMESPCWNQFNVAKPQAAICFSEHEYLVKGTTLDLDGVYRGLLQNNTIIGGWYKRGVLVGNFSFKA
jgi:hypothetical protein